MKELFFTLKVLLLTLVVVVVMQIEFGGQSLESRASIIFGRSATIDWIRTQSRYAIKKLNNKITEVKKVNQKTPLDKMIKNTPDLNHISETDLEGPKSTNNTNSIK